MLKLTNLHIDEIRRFFLASNQEEMLNIQKNISPSYLSKFLPQLRQLFNSKHLDEPELVSIAKNMGAAEHLESLKEIRQDYYRQLADLYNSGLTNGDIETLLSIQNIDFGAEVEFQKELKTAFQLNERAALKKKFQQLEKDYELSDDEINKAFKLSERERLKNQFENIEYENKTAASVIPFNWKKLAIAASVIGLIITTTFIITNNSEQNNIENNNLKKNHTDSADSLLKQKTVNNFNNIFAPSSEVNEIIVLKESSLGLANKEENLTLQKHYLEHDIIEIEKEITEELQGRTDKGYGPGAKLILAKKDSIFNLENKYSFDKDTLSVYLFSKKEIKVYKISTAYYMQIEDKVYKCKKTTILLPLMIVTDKAILPKINKLKSDNPE